MSADPLVEIVGQTYSTLKRVIPPAEDVAVLGYPAHQNFGDSLLYTGEKKYLDRLGYNISYLDDEHRYSADFLRRRHPAGPILFQGGGSLGDRYVKIQAYREQVIGDFPDRPIVVLPQSMDFTHPDAAARARQIFGGHRDLTLLLRDQVSLRKAREAFPDTRSEYCPDVAFGNGWLPTVGSPDVDLVMLFRGDTERAGSYDFNFSGMTSRLFDWHHSAAGNLAWNALAVPRGVNRRVPALRPYGQSVMESTFELIAWMNVRRARALLSTGHVVLTDRLHAAVLSALMKKPVVVLDNSYGKIAPIYQEYLSKLPSVAFARDVEEARDLVLRLHAERSSGAAVNR